MKTRRFPATERVLGGETVRYRDLPKTRLFPTTEPVLPPIPDNTDNGVPVYGGPFTDRYRTGMDNRGFFRP